MTSKKIESEDMMQDEATFAPTKVTPQKKPLQLADFTGLSSILDSI